MLHAFGGLLVKLFYLFENILIDFVFILYVVWIGIPLPLPENTRHCLECGRSFVVAPVCLLILGTPDPGTPSNRVSFKS